MPEQIVPEDGKIRKLRQYGITIVLHDYIYLISEFTGDWRWIEWSGSVFTGTIEMEETNN